MRDRTYESMNNQCKSRQGVSRFKVVQPNTMAVSIFEAISRATLFKHVQVFYGEEKFDPNPQRALSWQH